MMNSDLNKCFRPNFGLFPQLILRIYAILILTVEVVVVRSQVCTNVNQIGLNSCSSNCFKCRISSSSDFNEIPSNVKAMLMLFTPGSNVVLSERVFPRMVELLELEMSVSNLPQQPSIPFNFFSTLNQLQVLTIYHDLHSSVEFSLQLVNGSFAGLSSLMALYLADLGIQELPVGVFQGLGSLKVLDLNQNRLTSVGNGTFSPFLQLSSLNLAKNRIMDLRNVSFTGLSSVRSLDLHSNKLLQLRGAEMNLLLLVNLTEINLADNRLRYVDSYAFSGLRKLQKLYLEGNQLTTLSPNVFHNLVSLTELDVSDNLLNLLPRNVFSLETLNALYLNGNNLDSIVPDLFHGLVNLKTLDLQDNRITRVSEDAFRGLDNLEMLNLRNNSVDVVGSSSFLPLRRRLLQLNLQNNRLETLPRSSFDGLDALSHLDLSLNPWNCSGCENYWIAAWLQMNNKTDILVDQDNTTCFGSIIAPVSVSLIRAYVNSTCPFPFPSKITTTDIDLETLMTTTNDNMMTVVEILIIFGALFVAVVVIIVVVVVVVYCCHRRNRISQTSKPSDSNSGRREGEGQEREEGLRGSVTFDPNQEIPVYIIHRSGYDNACLVTDDDFLGQKVNQPVGQRQMVNSAPTREGQDRVPSVASDCRTTNEKKKSERQNGKPRFVYDNLWMMNDSNSII